MTEDYVINNHTRENKGVMRIEVRNPNTGSVRKLFTLPVEAGEVYRVDVGGDVHER